MTQSYNTLGITTIKKMSSQGWIKRKDFLGPRKVPSLSPGQRYQRTLERRVLRDWFLMIVKKELKDTLEKSITQEVVNEWGYNEMLRHTRKAYGPNPNAKGFYDSK